MSEISRDFCDPLELSIVQIATEDDQRIVRVHRRSRAESDQRLLEAALRRLIAIHRRAHQLQALPFIKEYPPSWRR